MKKITKKQTLCYCLFLLMAFHALHAAKSAYEPVAQTQKIDYTTDVPALKREALVYGYCRTYHVPTDLCFFIRCLVYNNPLRYRNKPLPLDLSAQDLSGFDFTGCHFTHTNLTDSNLANTILTNTTCDYQKSFQDNIKKNKLHGGDWYQENLPKDLQSIATVYPQLNNNIHKSKLLHIACGLSQLPFYEGPAFYIKVAYWSYTLRQLKKMLSNPYAHQLVCSLQTTLEYDANNYCWRTNYPQDKVNMQIRAPHANFGDYLKDFTSGLSNYQCNSRNNYGFNCYKNNIIKNIEGLAVIYPHIRDKQLQQEACDIAHALSKSYQIQQMFFLNHYLFYQHQLIRFKKSVGLGVKNKVYYSVAHVSDWLCGWIRGEK